MHRTLIRLIGAALLAALAAGLLTPGAAAQTGGACGDPATRIHEVQGIGERTPLGGQSVTVEGVVVGDYQDPNTELGGFFLEEEGADFDENPLTSEGLFVDSALSQVDVSVGDRVRVTGSVFELSEGGAALTQLRRLESVLICDRGAAVAPVTLMLPVRGISAWEAFEGMLVAFPQTLTVTEVYNLGRYGELTLSAGGRLYGPTQVAAPGPEALEIQGDNALRAILLDDGSSQQNLDPTRYPAGGLSAANVLRVGDTVAGLTGVVDQRNGAYRLYASEPPVFQPANPRAAAPGDVGAGLRVASFNMLNYFNGDGRGGGFPTPRGAASREEFERQQAKIVSALLGLDAAVLGLTEIENDGSGPDSALASLTDALNAAAGAGTYAYLPDPAGLPDPQHGGDAIKQAILYQPALVTPAGDAALTRNAPFGGRRPPLAQAFADAASGERFVVVVNHFKSKGCEGAAGDPDRGQGCWNEERTQAARTLLDWLASDPTGAGDPDVLLLGDFNSYAHEDPVQTLLAADYVDLADRFSDAPTYSYVYFGQAGTLDYALANPSLAEQVGGATIWHINADEPNVFDYNVEYKSARQVASLYDPGPYRSSDHDPVLVGLALRAPEGGPAAQALPTATGELVEPTAAPTSAPTATEAPPTAAPTTTAAATATITPTAEAASLTPAATEVTPQSTGPLPVEGGGSDLNDSTWGYVAVGAGLVAVALAMLLGWWWERRRRE